VSIDQSTRRGFHARSLAQNAGSWFKEQGTQDRFDVVMVDWPIASRLAPLLHSLNLPMVLIDRSPPADSGLFGWLQWGSWKRAWRLVDKGVMTSGTVVSPAHAAFVTKRCAVENTRIFVVPAGVDLERFTPLPTSAEELRLVYHGRLDKHRGVLSLPMLGQHLVNEGRDVRMTLIGEGDAQQALMNIATSSSWLDVRPTMPQSHLTTELARHHVGLLPMPDSTVWALASPLKRSEYLASGLLVLGIDHDGHRLKRTDPSWFSLYPQSSFHRDAVAWLSELDSKAIERGQKEARAYAEASCSWSASVEGLIEALTQAMES
jgi:glycosyltransferase involved in cell wall biosynthesis